MRLWPPAEKRGVAVPAGRSRSSTSPPVTESGLVDAAVTVSFGVAAEALDSTIGPATSGLASRRGDDQADSSSRHEAGA